MTSIKDLLQENSHHTPVTIEGIPVLATGNDKELSIFLQDPEDEHSTIHVLARHTDNGQRPSDTALSIQLQGRRGWNITVTGNYISSSHITKGKTVYATEITDSYDIYQFIGNF